MILKNLILGFEYLFTDIVDENIEVLGIAFDTRDVKSGFAFFCLEGSNTDGHNFASQAENLGASVIFVERRVENVKAVQIVCKSTRKALAVCCCNYFGNPSQKLKMIGITGTNGKTSSTYILAEILKASGKKVGVIGTNGVVFDGKVVESNMTTPDPIFLNSVLKDMVQAKTEVCVMEVSAHALALFKTMGIIFDVVEFLNLTQDHLDFFHTMEEYGKAKQMLFSSVNARYAVFNGDDEYSFEIAKHTDLKHIFFSCTQKESVSLENCKQVEDKMCLTVNVFGNTFYARTNLLGSFNASNIVGACAVASLLGVRIENIKKGIESVQAVKGRFNCLNLKDHGLAVVDFAHTPDGMHKILVEGRKLAKGKLVCVFGCGGNRDRTKRPIMGEIAGTMCDIIYLTSDNPRYENPLDIINDISVGTNKTDAVVFKEADRKKALRLAIKNARKEDVVMVLGKGAEPYLEIEGKKVPYNDTEEIQKVLKEMDYE